METAIRIFENDLKLTEDSNGFIIIKHIPTGVEALCGSGNFIEKKLKCIKIIYETLN